MDLTFSFYPPKPYLICPLPQWIRLLSSSLQENKARLPLLQHNRLGFLIFMWPETQKLFIVHTDFCLLTQCQVTRTPFKNWMLSTRICFLYIHSLIFGTKAKTDVLFIVIDPQLVVNCFPDAQLPRNYNMDSTNKWYCESTCDPNPWSFQ